MSFPMVLILALVILAGLTTPAHAEPISASIVSVLTWATVGAKTAAIIASAVITTSISMGLSYVAAAIRGAPKQDPFGVKSTVQFGGTVPRTVPFGRWSTPGSMVYPSRTWGQSGKTPNAYYTQVIALGDIPAAGLAAILLDDKRCEYNTGVAATAWGYPIAEYKVGGKDHLWVRFHDGNQTAADSWLRSQFGSDPDYPFTSDMIGKGVPYAIVTALVNPELFSGLPQPRFEILGGKFYDPREDSTVGGDGAQRWNTPSTWTHTENPLVVAYNALRGIAWNGNWLYGLQGTAPARLPLDSWFAGMNACDADRDLAAGGTEKNYRCGGEVAVDTEPSTFLEELFKTCNARFAEIGGYMKVRVGVSGAAVMTFTDGDLIVTEPQSSDPFPGLKDTVNRITGTYPEPVENWAMRDAPARFDPDFEEADGDRQLVSQVAYNFAPFAEQVQYLMQSALDEARRFRRHNAVAPPEAWQLEPLDLIARTSDREGYENKLFDIVPVDQEDLNQSLSMIEVDPSDYNWDPESQYVPVTPVPVVGQVIASQAMDGFAIAPVTIAADGGRSLAAIRLTWTVEDNDDVKGILYEIRLASVGHPIVKSGETFHFGGGTLDVSENIKGGTEYQVRAKFLTLSPRETEWSDWLSVTTDIVGIVGAEITDGAVERAHLDDTLRDFETIVGNATRELTKQVQQLSGAIAQGAFGQASDLQFVRQRMVSNYNTLTASYESAILVATGPGSAIAQQITALQAAIADPVTGLAASATAIAGLQATVTTQGSAITANSASITTLTAGLATANSNITANTSAIAGLTSTVSTQGSAITANTSSIATLTAGLATANSNITANSSAISGLSSTVTAQGTDIATNTSNIASLTSSLATTNSNVSANSGAISTLNTSVSTLSGTVTSQGSSITSLTSSLATTNSNVSTNTSNISANSTAITGLTSTVTSQGSSISSLSSSLTSLSSTVGNFSASGLFRVQTQSTPSGADASIAMMVAASGGGSPYTAALFLDAMSGGTTRIRMLASQFSFTDGTNNTVPFSYSGGVLYINNATVKDLTADNLHGNAVTQPEFIQKNGGYTWSMTATGSQDLASHITASRTYRQGSNVEVEWVGQLNFSAGAGTGYTVSLVCERSDGTALYGNGFYLIAQSVAGIPTVFLGSARYVDDAPIYSGASTYKLKFISTGGTGSKQVSASTAFMKVTEFKA